MDEARRVEGVPRAPVRFLPSFQEHELFGWMVIQALGLGLMLCASEDAADRGRDGWSIFFTVMLTVMFWTYLKTAYLWGRWR